MRLKRCGRSAVDTILEVKGRIPSRAHEEIRDGERRLAALEETEFPRARTRRYHEEIHIPRGDTRKNICVFTRGNGKSREREKDNYIYMCDVYVFSVFVLLAIFPQTSGKCWEKWGNVAAKKTVFDALYGKNSASFPRFGEKWGNVGETILERLLRKSKRSLRSLAYGLRQVQAAFVCAHFRVDQKPPCFNSDGWQMGLPYRSAWLRARQPLSPAVLSL